MPIAEREVVILNAHGLHVRPATKFAEEADRFVSEISVSKDGALVNGKAIIELLTLAATAGTVLRIRAEGPDADKAVEHLATLVRNKFGIE
jgi:phosphotransferase system HPr (HPr) family protein